MSYKSSIPPPTWQDLDEVLHGDSENWHEVQALKDLVSVIRDQMRLGVWNLTAVRPHKAQILFTLEFNNTVTREVFGDQESAEHLKTMINE